MRLTHMLDYSHMRNGGLIEGLEFLKQWLDFRVRQVDIPGLTISIYKGEVEVFSRAYGYADVELGIPMSREHLFSVGSQSKMITSTAVLQLVAKGAITLDHPVMTYVPWLQHHPDKRFNRLTTRDLLRHTGGLIRDGDDSDFWLGNKPYPNNQELRQTIEAEPLCFDPQSSMKYSNLGYALLGEVIRKVSGREYSTYVEENIQRAAHITHLYPDWHPSHRSTTAIGYTLPFERKRIAIHKLTACKAFSPAAGCIATASAIGKFAATLCAKRLIADNKLQEEALSKQWSIVNGYDQGYEYGLGFEILRVANRRLLGHGGTMLGYRTATFFEPHEKLVVAVCANCKDAPVIAILSGIFEALFHFIDTDHSVVPPTTSRLNMLMRNSLTNLQVVATADSIIAIDPNSWEPFTWSESLTSIDDNTLRVSTHNSIHSTGEKLTIKTSPSDETVVAKFGGMTMNQLSSSLPSEVTRFNLPLESANALFHYYLGKSHNRFFMLEVLPEYKMDMQYDGSGDSLKAWLKGYKLKSKALLDGLATQHLRQPQWLRNYPIHAGIRIRIIDDVITPYMKWEQEHFARINVPLLGEKIYYISRNKLDGLLLPTGDMSICSQGPIIINHYEQGRHVSSDFFDRKDDATRRLLAIRKSLLQLVQKGQYSEELM